ncbi:zinc finger MYM-type protein 1-like protein [Tanacetum coccineum]
MDNRLRLQVTINSTKWLTLQTCPLRGDDEQPTSLNQGNLLELVDLIASYNKDVARVWLNAHKNAKYTSLDIQKEVLQLYAMKFLDLVHVKDINALTLKNEILSSLSYLKLDVQDKIFWVKDMMELVICMKSEMD